jgi:hypothetical protein
MANVTPEPIVKIALGFMAAKHLFAANEIGLFEALAGGPARLDDSPTKPGFRSERLASSRPRWSVWGSSSRKAAPTAMATP